jgi:CheY-like chemotaxis protein
LRKESERQINAHTLALEATNRELSRLRVQADSANQAKTSFLANMSHEIRTPMTAILGYADLLADGHLDGRERRDAVETIRRSGRHLIELISDILDLSKIEADHLVVEKIDCNVIALVNDLISLLRVKASEKRIALSVEYRGEIPEMVRTDPMRLRQILSNLIGNAIKFTDQGEVRVVVIGSAATRGLCQLQCQVIDSGVGIRPEHFSKLFQPFSQVDPSPTRRLGGTGLGLAISRRLARLLGGDIQVDSQEGLGSTFTLTLLAEVAVDAKRCCQPLESFVSLDEQPALALEAPLLDRRVLIAEDGPDNQRLISMVLRKAGADAVVAENGQVAFDAVLAAETNGRAFDLVIMDMQMPVLDGYEATKALRRHGYSRPIIALTAHALAADREKCLAAGCSDYATKPIDRNHLIDLLIKHVRNVDAALQAQSLGGIEGPLG